jgi:hypothetical protein
MKNKNKNALGLYFLYVNNFQKKCYELLSFEVVLIALSGLKNKVGKYLIFLEIIITIL